jgi:PAS domain S-box-containing protein/putative nucleotidyltransferase with HDIG domain
VGDDPTASVESYAHLIDELAHAVVVTTADGEIVLWNKGAEALFGVTTAEAVGMLLNEAVPTATIAGSEATPAGVVGDPHASERWVCRRDGSLVPVHERRTAVRDDAGAASRHLIELYDLSDRVSLRRRFETAFETAPHGWGFTDLDGRFTAANEALCKILGRSRRDVIGHRPIEFTAPGDVHRTAPLAAMLAGEMDTFACRKRLVRADGTVRWVDVDVRLLRDHNGQPEQFFGHVIDVTEWIDSTDQYRQLFDSVVTSFAASHELSDPFTAGHQQRVAHLAGAIGERMGLGDHVCEGLAVGALLHDVGKVATPVQILIKPGELNSAEYDLVKRHARDGHDILAHIDFPWPIAEMILQHHERMDGSGYPRSLTGDEILLEARIVAVADTVETVSSHRPYKSARPLHVALDLIASERGRLFDPDVVGACLAVFEGGFALNDRT